MVCLAMRGQETVNVAERTVYGQTHSVDLTQVSWESMDALLQNADVKGRLGSAPLMSGLTDGYRWIDRIHNLPDYLLQFYNRYGRDVQDVLDGKNNCLSDPTLGIYNEDWNNYSTLVHSFEGNVDFTFPTDATYDDIERMAYQYVMDTCDANWMDADCFLSYLILCLTYDYPEAFWLNSYFRWFHSWNYRYSFNRSTGIGTITYSQNLYFTLMADDFDYRRTEFNSREKVSAGVEEYHGLVDQILEGCPSGSRYDKIVYFNDWLTTHNSYNTLYGHSNNVPTIAWSPMSALRGSVGTIGPVCEGYARAFKLLCDQTDIPCILAVGNAKGSRYAAGESHMWNEVRMENDQWYAVDCTWNDPTDSQNRKRSGYENHNWLLLGKNDVVGSNQFTFEQSHPFSITWDTNPGYASRWDCSIASFIADEHYDVTTDIPAIRTTEIATAPAYDISGRALGTANAIPVNANGQLLIVGGRKVLVK